MADSVVKLTINSQEYDNKLKRAADGLTRYADKCRQVGGTLEVVEKDTLDFVKAIGQMETVSRSANGKLSEMKKTYTELSMQYKQLTAAEKQSPFGKALAQSLDQLKPRILEAKELRYTEPDPRDDLNGMDVARKGLIIAREAGYDIELTDVEVLKVFPDDFDTSGSTEEFLKRLPQVDDYFKKKIEGLKKQNKVLRMGATVQDGKCTVGMFEVGPEDPLYAVKGGENAFVFHTARYQPIPLTVRGYGAGAGVTAAGVFGDILRTVSFNTER